MGKMVVNSKAFTPYQQHLFSNSEQGLHVEVTTDSTFIQCANPENIHTPPTQGFLFAPPVTPGNSSLASYFASKILTFKTPLSLGISDDLPWGGYGFFSGTAQCMYCMMLSLHLKPRPQ